MSVMIEMVRDSAEAGGLDRFAVGTAAWELLFDVGKAFGWRPAGTMYSRKSPAKETETAALRDYLPGNHRDRKRIDADDATAWATALDAALRSPKLGELLAGRTGVVVLGDDATAEQTRSANAPFDVTMKEFIQYAYGGAFSFAKAE
jgi:hypothetical protein